VTNAAYWRDHVRRPVRFNASVQGLVEQGYRVFVEVGPHPVLLGMAAGCVPQEKGIWLPSLRRGRADWQQILESLSGLYLEGAEVDWQGFDRDYPRRKTSLPAYPFQRKCYWIPKIHRPQIEQMGDTERLHHHQSGIERLNELANLSEKEVERLYSEKKLDTALGNIDMSGE
jgi:acyl transferase domain-containing protein